VKLLDFISLVGLLVGDRRLRFWNWFRKLFKLFL